MEIFDTGGEESELSAHPLILGVRFETTRAWLWRVCNILHHFQSTAAIIQLNTLEDSVLEIQPHVSQTGPLEDEIYKNQQSNDKVLVTCPTWSIVAGGGIELTSLIRSSFYFLKSPSSLATHFPNEAGAPANRLIHWLISRLLSSLCTEWERGPEELKKNPMIDGLEGSIIMHTP